MKKRRLKKTFKKYVFRRDFFKGLKRVARRQLARKAFYDQKSILAAAGIPVTTVFDVGANVGDITAVYLKHFPTAQIHCFEPFPATFERLSKRFEHNSSVLVCSCAISNKSSTISLHITDSDFQHSILHPLSQSYSDSGSRVIEVKSVTLDDYCKSAQVARLNVCKFDIQGGELKALEGAKELLCSSQIDLIYTEFLITPVYSGQPLLHDLSLYLAQYGYLLFNIYNLSEYNVGQIAQGDAIFLSSSIRKGLLDKFGWQNTGYLAIQKAEEAIYEG